MTEIVVHGMVIGGAGKAAAMTMLTGPVGPLLVAVIGLLLLGAFVRQVLFTPIEEAGPLPDPDPRHVSPAVPERCRLRDPGLLRSYRHGL